MVRNAYLKKVEERLSRLDEEIDVLRKRAESTSAEARAMFVRQVASLQSQAESARERIRSVREAGAASWGVLKKGVDESIRDLRKGIDEAVQRFRKTGSDNR